MPDFDEDAIRFQGEDLFTICVILFQLLDQRFATQKKKLVVRNIELDKIQDTPDTTHSASTGQTVSGSNTQEVVTSAVTAQFEI